MVEAPSAIIVLFIVLLPFLLSGCSSSIKNSNYMGGKRDAKGGIGHKKKEQLDRQEERMDTVISLPGLFLGWLGGGRMMMLGGKGGPRIKSRGREGREGESGDGC